MYLFQLRKIHMEQNTGKSFEKFLNYSDNNNKEGARVKVCLIYKICLFSWSPQMEPWSEGMAYEW